MRKIHLTLLTLAFAFSFIDLKQLDHFHISMRYFSLTVLTIGTLIEVYYASRAWYFPLISLIVYLLYLLNLNQESVLFIFGFLLMTGRFGMDYIMTRLVLLFNKVLSKKVDPNLFFEFQDNIPETTCPILTKRIKRQRVSLFFKKES
jgi:hypothetical protein